MKVSIRQQHAVLNESIRSKRLRGLRLRLRIAAVLLGVMGFVFSDTAYASPAEPNPTMRVRVLNYTQATPATVAQAEREAARILGEAGLKTVWLDCPLVEAKVVPQDPCQQPFEANEIWSECSRTRRDVGIKTTPLVLQLPHCLPVSTTNMQRDSPGFTMPSSRCPLFWDASWSMRSATCCLATTATRTPE